MSRLFFTIEAIEARIASYSCPRGTPGRVHALRLRRRFQPSSRPQSTAVGGYRKWTTLDDSAAQSLAGVDFKDELQQLLGKRERAASLGVHSDSENSLNLSSIVDIPTSKADDARPNLASVEEHHAPTHGRRLPPRILKAYYGDTFGLPSAQHDYHFHPQSLDGSNLNRAIDSGNPYAIFTSLLRLVKLGDNGYEGHEVLNSLSPNAFSEILRVLDPVYFVGRYVDLHKQISSRHPVYLSFQSQKGHGQHQFCVNFIARIRSIIEARRSKGFSLSLYDYKYLLRCARAVGNQRASHALWLAMERDNVKPDTECYNHYLAAKVWSDTLNSSQRYKVRVIPKYLELRKAKVPSLDFQGHLVGPGNGIKYQTTRIFDEMVQNGHVGDEETFCLLMVALAREGDVDGAKAILDKLWGIDVDRLLKKGEDGLKPPISFSKDSPLRPSEALLFSIAHALGINNEIPTALRLIDYVSRIYSIPIPGEVWEELLERTFVLGKKRTAKDTEDGHSTGQLPPAAVSNLWAALVAEPYNAKPTMAMYDKLIVNLLRRQKFGEVQAKLEEARQLHIEAVCRYSNTLALIKRYSSIPGPAAKPVTRQYLLNLKRDEAYHHLIIHRSRQYLRRWCRLFIILGTKSLQHNPTFIVVNLPEFILRYMTFMPRLLEYSISTGAVRFRTGYEELNKVRIEGYKAQKSWPANMIPFKSLEPLEDTNIAMNEDEKSASNPDLEETDEMFGRS